MIERKLSRILATTTEGTPTGTLRHGAASPVCAKREPFSALTFSRGADGPGGPQATFGSSGPKSVILISYELTLLDQLPPS